MKRIALVLALVGCGGSDPADLTAAPVVQDAAVEQAIDAAAEPMACPEGMTLVGAACVDTAQVSHDAYFDWHSDGGAVTPEGCDPSETNLVDNGVKACGAVAWCQAHGRRLCALDEWMPACKARIGPAQGNYGPEWLGPFGGGQQLAGGWYDKQECQTGYISPQERARFRCCADPS